MEMGKEIRRLRNERGITQEALAAALERVRTLREAGASLRDAVRQASQETGMNKNALYKLATQNSGSE